MISFKPIDDEESQRVVWMNFHAKLKPNFIHSAALTWDDVLRYKVGEPELNEFSLIFARADWVGMRLNGPSLANPGKWGRLLEFTTRTPKGGRPAAMLASGGQKKFFLFHDGRVTPRDERSRPHSAVMHEFGGRDYFLVSELDDSTFFSNVVRFHLSRVNPDLGIAKLTSTAGFDPGPENGGVRAEATFTAAHHPLAKALKLQLELADFEVAGCDVVSPDLLVTRGKDGNALKILFEVKPKASFHDLVLGCGQLLVYNQHAKAGGLVIVCPEMQDSKLSTSIIQFMNSNSIFHLSYDIIKSDYIFSDLKNLISRLSAS